MSISGAGTVAGTKNSLSIGVRWESRDGEGWKECVCGPYFCEPLFYRLLCTEAVDTFRYNGDVVRQYARSQYNQSCEKINQNPGSPADLHADRQDVYKWVEDSL
jgi:hypothetical protein